MQFYEIRWICKETPFLFYFFIKRKQEDMYGRGAVVQVFGEMVAREWVIGRMESEAIFIELVV
jgi:hypothetical protein